MVIFTPPGFAPLSWHLSPDQVKHWNGPIQDFFISWFNVRRRSNLFQVDKLRSAQSEEEWKALLSTLAEQLDCRVKQRSVQNAVRYCEKCLAIKPDRSVFKIGNPCASWFKTGLTTVPYVRDVPLKWTTTARGSTIASAFIITKWVMQNPDGEKLSLKNICSFSCSFSDTRYYTASGSQPPLSDSSSASGFTGRRTLWLGHTSK